jgi:hypothetical protein
VRGLFFAAAVASTEVDFHLHRPQSPPLVLAGRGEIDRFPGGRKSGAGWVTPRMWERRTLFFDGIEPECASKPNALKQAWITASEPERLAFVDALAKLPAEKQSSLAEAAALRLHLFAWHFME